VKLPGTFGTRKNYRTEFIVFDVAHIGLPYNAILGYPALTKFMAATHHAYGLVKMADCSGTLTVHYDEKDELQTLEQAYKAAATAYPADEDVPGPTEEMPMKKKPLLSQERVKSEKASLEGGEAGPSLTVSGGPSLKCEGTLVTFLRASPDALAWIASGELGLPREVIEHHSAACQSVRPVK
jgi:hypothetical protein